MGSLLRLLNCPPGRQHSLPLCEQRNSKRRKRNRLRREERSTPAHVFLLQQNYHSSETETGREMCERDDNRGGGEWGLEKEVSHRFSIAPTAPYASPLQSNFSVNICPQSKRVWNCIKIQLVASSQFLSPVIISTPGFSRVVPVYHIAAWDTPSLGSLGVPWNCPSLPLSQRTLV